MKTIKMTPAELIKQVELGFIQHVECISLFVKKCYLLDVRGNKELVAVDLK